MAERSAGPRTDLPAAVPGRQTASSPRPARAGRTTEVATIASTVFATVAIAGVESVTVNLTVARPLKVAQLQGHQLPAWIEAATTTDPTQPPDSPGIWSATSTPSLPDSRNRGTPASSKGHVNRMKRQMFGRAGFELLRKRVLLAQ
ncbi:hypothetical protein OG851_01525 [Streptomyces sp. NBC_00161]|uniref:hypothetical protein n=1 Tax=Streptomyces sp. NBC_00161 TaxID=2975671 RepID=UPI003250033E